MKNLRFILFLFSLASCSDSNKALLDKLKTAVETESADAKGYQVIALEDLTDFDWDTMYYFQELTSEQEINNEIGFSWEGSEVPNLHHRLLFVHQGQVVSFMDYNYTDFPLAVYGCNQDRWVYPRSRAVFATFEYCRGEEEVYTFIPEPCLENVRELIGQQCAESSAAE